MGHARQLRCAASLARRLRLGSFVYRLGAVGLCLWATGCKTASVVAPPRQVTSVSLADRPMHPAARGVSDGVVVTPGQDPNVKVLPISLDTVLRLAGEQNAQVALARERLHQASDDRCAAGLAWMPNVYVGTAYWRHEGGIQNQDGTLQHSSFGGLFGGTEVVGSLNVQDAIYQQVDAERKVWQQRGELSKITNEQLLDATSTYIDLLTARTGEMVAAELEKYEEDLRAYAEKLARPNVDPGSRVQVVAIEATINGHRQSLLRTRQQGDAAAAKLAYLLGLGTCVQLIHADRYLAPLDIIDANVPSADLLAQAWANGPGVKELEGLLGTIQDGMAKSQGWTAKLPVFEVHMLEGAFGAGPGDELSWDNRWDLGVQARWNLTDLLASKDKLRSAHSKLHQVELTYQDLRGKLAMGVQEAQEAIRSGREQMALAEKQVERAREAYRLSSQRLKANVGAPGEVLQAIRGLEMAQVSKLQVVREYDKAQLRLMLLLGPVGTCR